MCLVIGPECLEVHVQCITRFIGDNGRTDYSHQCTLSHAHARVYGNTNWTIYYRVCNRKRTTTQIQILHGTYLHDKPIQIHS